MIFERRLDRFQVRQFHFRVAAVVVGGSGLGGGLQRARLLLGRRVVGLALLVDERRNRDRGEDADDQDDDQKLDEGETTLIT